MTLALVRDMHELRAPSGGDEGADFKTDVLAVSSWYGPRRGLTDSMIRNDTGHLNLIRDLFSRPLGKMRPEDADAYFAGCYGTRSRRRPPGGHADGLFPVLELQRNAEITVTMSHRGGCAG
jgi:hypothetical protein